MADTATEASNPQPEMETTAEPQITAEDTATGNLLAGEPTVKVVSAESSATEPIATEDIKVRPAAPSEESSMREEMRKPPSGSKGERRTTKPEPAEEYEKEYDFSKYKRELLGESSAYEYRREYDPGYDYRSRSPSYGASLGRSTKYEPDEYTSRLIDKALGGAYRSTEERLLGHPILDDNRPEPFTNPKISPRSRKVIREGYMLGFTNSQGIRALYDVIMT
jgi:hypothetical protein